MKQLAAAEMQPKIGSTGIYTRGPSREYGKLQ